MLMEEYYAFFESMFEKLNKLTALIIFNLEVIILNFEEF
jgi:hypothetical protein